MEDLIARLKDFASLGVGGALAAMMFYFYRQAFLRERTEKTQERAVLVDVVTKNAEANTGLKDAVQALAQSVDRAEANRQSQVDLLRRALERIP